MKIALDATYSLGENLSGVGVYSRELLSGLAEAHPEAEFLWYYRPRRFVRALGGAIPGNCRRRVLWEGWSAGGQLLHGLNQRLPRVKPRRAIATFHDLFVLTGEYSTGEFRRRFAAQARDAAARADAIIAVSEFTARQVEGLLGVPRRRIRVVRHGVLSHPASYPETGAPREPVILHVGAIQVRKNIARLVAAFEALDPPWRLVLAGAAGYGAAGIFARIARSPARERIVTPGYVSEAALAEWYGRATVFAFPSLDEGFGMPVLDAMAAGVPVLTSNRSALPEVAGDAALLVDPEDDDAVAAGLRKLTTDEDLRSELRERGLRRAQQFSWAEAVLETWKLYQEV